MNRPASSSEPGGEHISREELLSAMFAEMVVQQANMAMMLLGKVAHPETGQFIQNIDGARMFIDQLEMIEAKTKGNLNKQEEGLLKQALSALRMAFVEAVESPAEEKKSAPAEPPPAAPSPSATAPEKPPISPETPPSEESRKKFSKKY
jgi:hypothetical protein